MSYKEMSGFVAKHNKIKAIQNKSEFNEFSVNSGQSGLEGEMVGDTNSLEIRDTF